MMKFKRTFSLLMMSAMLLLQVSVPVQAKEVIDCSKSDITNISPRSDINYPTPALITEANVPMKETPEVSGNVIMTLQQGYFIQIDKDNAIESDGITWYPCKYGYVYGYVNAQYVRIIGQ